MLIFLLWLLLMAATRGLTFWRIHPSPPDVCRPQQPATTWPGAKGVPKACDG